MCQWVPLDRLPEEHYKRIVRTFIEVFPYTTIWYKYTPDFAILIGTPEQLKVNYRRFMERAQIPSVREDLAGNDLDGMSLLDSFMMGDTIVRQYVGNGPIHIDNRPRLEFFRSQELVNTTYKNLEGMVKYRERVTPYLTNYGRTMAEKIEERKKIDLYFKATQRLIQGQIEYAKWQYERAVSLFNQALTINPGDETIRYNFEVAIGLVREGEQDEFKQLEQEVKRILRRDPEDVEGYIHLAVIHESQGKLVEATEALEEALKYAPARPDLYVLLGPIYERQERYDEALRTYQRFEKLDPNPPSIIFTAMASIYHFHKKMLPEALKYAQKALRADPNSWRVHDLLGNIYADRNEVKKAIDSFKQAMKFAPNEPMPRSDLAHMCFAQKRYGEALKAIDEAIRLVPDEPYFQEQRRQIQEAMMSDKK
jgi:spermidine synthase